MNSDAFTPITGHLRQRFAGRDEKCRISPPKTRHFTLYQEVRSRFPGAKLTGQFAEIDPGRPKLTPMGRKKQFGEGRRCRPFYSIYPISVRMRGFFFWGIFFGAAGYFSQKAVGIEVKTWFCELAGTKRDEKGTKNLEMGKNRQPWYCGRNVDRIFAVSLGIVVRRPRHLVSGLIAKNTTFMRIFVGIRFNVIGQVCECVVSQTKVGIAELIGVSVRTVERWLGSEVGLDKGEGATVGDLDKKSGWVVICREAMGNRSRGNTGNLRPRAGVEN